MIAESLSPELFGVFTDGGDIEFLLNGLCYGIAEGFCGQLVDQQTGFSLTYGFERAAAAQRHNRPAARLGFERDDAKILLARQEDDGRASVQHSNFII